MSATALLRDKVLTYWFKGIQRDAALNPSIFKVWFGGGPEVDEYIKKEFAESIQRVHNDIEFQTELISEPEGAMTAIILLDQFTRNAFRNTPEMFMYDPLARSIASKIVEQQWDVAFHPVWRGFTYLPYEHSEDIKDQETCIRLYSKLKDDIQAHESDSKFFGDFAKSFQQYSLDHQKIILKFGRYPHRNQILGRVSTQEEIDYLANGGQTF